MNTHSQPPRTCEYCRWYKIVEGEFEPPFRTTWRRCNAEICLYNPPSGGVFPWSFGETASDMTCSKWEPKDARP